MIIKSALLSKCNMNHQVHEETWQALGELKSSIEKNIENVNYLETCKRSLIEAIAKSSYASVMISSDVMKDGLQITV
ncbi:hypothetical protein TNCT_204861 [Trichonephila clavata]|uniref:Uncharacterized protein n=1 Tax=Trichonephila clavata TaxID=2740835 RepID=A0A8X6IEG4_TRICU|nr:hypothetical protein TNCT_204861 [Trichonephila clavata]